MQFTRDVANITMDLNSIETIQISMPLGGADTITVGDLTGTQSPRSAIDLGASAAAATARRTR